MIVFLTLCYFALLVVLQKIKIIKPTIGWKLSPLFFFLICLILLAVPMQWGAPSGPVNVFRYVIEIVPNVSGEVVDVPVVPHKSLKEGDVLYQIDRRSFQAEVDFDFPVTTPTQFLVRAPARQSPERNALAAEAH